MSKYKIVFEYKDSGLSGNLIYMDQTEFELDQALEIVNEQNQQFGSTNINHYLEAQE